MIGQVEDLQRGDCDAHQTNKNLKITGGSEASSLKVTKDLLCACNNNEKETWSAGEFLMQRNNFNEVMFAF